MNYTVLNRDDLPYDGNTYEFQGIQHQDTHVSFIWVDMPPGGTIRLHKHPYPYGGIFIIQEGLATFTVGSATLEACAGQVIIVPAEVPHKFRNLSCSVAKIEELAMDVVDHRLDDGFPPL